MSRAATLLLLTILAPSAVAQTEYYNLDVGRPLRVQDAYAIERYGWDLQLGPAFSGPSGSGSTWALETALAYGALPRTQLELAAPLASAPAAGGGHTTGIDGLDLGALYNLNTETSSLPAFAAAAHVVLPVGSLGPASTLFSVEGIATRSFSGFRIHLDASATIGPSGGGTGALERSRWFAGAAIDRAWPLSSVLGMLEVVALQPLADSSAIAWSAGAGARVQWTPTLVLDGGVSRRFTGADQAWSATLGVTWSFAVRAFMPVAQ
jgi:hypothetical protein